MEAGRPTETWVDFEVEGLRRRKGVEELRQGSEGRQETEWT
jgi:hypothetical protein